MIPDESKNVSLEANMQRLDKILQRLDDGSTTLEDSLKNYEEGIRLIRESYHILESAEKRILILSGEDESQVPVVEP